MSDEKIGKNPPKVDDLTPQEIQGVIRRDRKHLAEICRRLIPIYRAIARSRLVATSQHSHAKEEDLCQSLMEATLREETVRKWNPELGQLSTFLRVFVCTSCRDTLQKRSPNGLVKMCRTSINGFSACERTS